jgi:hypothetical protein
MSRPGIESAGAQALLAECLQQRQRAEAAPAPAKPRFAPGEPPTRRRILCEAADALLARGDRRNGKKQLAILKWRAAKKARNAAGSTGPSVLGALHWEHAKRKELEAAVAALDQALAKACDLVADWAYQELLVADPAVVEAHLTKWRAVLGRTP